MAETQERVSSAPAHPETMRATAAPVTTLAKPRASPVLLSPWVLLDPAVAAVAPEVVAEVAATLSRPAEEPRVAQLVGSSQTSPA